MTDDFLTCNYPAFRDGLSGSGWRTPQTYCSDFSSACDFPAVYIFALVDRDMFLKSRVAYVGMSTRLSQRWSGHPILKDLDGIDAWVQKWFLRVPEESLRKVELENIQRFDPPWNISGRRRGLAAL